MALNSIGGANPNRIRTRRSPLSDDGQISAPAPIRPVAPLPIRPFDVRTTSIAENPGVSNRKRGTIQSQRRRSTGMFGTPAVPQQAMQSQTSMDQTRRRLFLVNILQ